jgi:hypothetical protein
VRRSAEDMCWNPYSWRIEESARLGTSPSDQERRVALDGELLLAEAREVADGVRHLSIAHGHPRSLDESRHLHELVIGLKQVAQRAPWFRLRGGPDHVIVAVAGPRADDLLDELAALVAAADPGGWRVTTSARPQLT